jgi:membrane complex biogenesis BtpA family protein
MNNQSRIKTIFGEKKPIIGMVHLPPSPGQPQSLNQMSLELLVKNVKKDVQALVLGDVDGLLFCNESDLPYTTKVSQEVGAWAAYFIGEMKSIIDKPYGINLLWDPIASIAVAASTGASFVREVMCGTFASEMGVLQPDPALIAQTRTRLRAEHIALLTNIVPEFASALESRTVAQRARAAAYFGFDALLVSGPVAGEEFSADDVIEAKTTSGNVPVFANTGVRIENIEKTLQVSDGVIIGSSLKFDGKTFNPIDPNRVKQFMEKVEILRNKQKS